MIEPGQGLVRGHHHHVAGARADDFHQGARLDAGADGAQVSVKCSNGNWDAGRQANLGGHFRRQIARLLIRRHCHRGVAATDLHQIRIDRGQKLLGRQAAPLPVVHGLVARRAHAARHRQRIEIACDEARDKVSELHPGIGSGEHGRAGSLAVKEFGPEPLGAVSPAAFRQIGGAQFAGLLGDLGGLGMGRMILPKPRMSGQILGVLRLHGERHPVAVDGDGSRAGGVHANSDDLLRRELDRFLSRLDGPPNGAVEPFDVVCWVLPGEVRVLGIQQNAVVAAGIVVHRGADLRAIGGVDHQGPHAIGSVIDADGIPFRSRLSHTVGLLA
jgi:uncharacterized protein YijF (DUF1287 family)